MIGSINLYVNVKGASSKTADFFFSSLSEKLSCLKSKIIFLKILFMYLFIRLFILDTQFVSGFLEVEDEPGTIKKQKT